MKLLLKFDLRKMRIPKYILSFIFFLMPCVLFAQAGKITGTLLDAETKEPLIGATVGIQGTTKGAITDIDGNYLMLNVAPGTYIIEARYIGYATVVVQEVIVRTGLTTEQDFELAPESFEGEELVVVAEREVILKDVTSSESRVSSDEIEKLPVQELNDVVRLQSGVNVSDDGGIHIRGGRSSEVSYVVDGIRVTDDYDRSNGVRIENESVQELQVISGTFNAEHGQAMSGIVNVVTKSGGNNFDASLNVWGGDYLVSRPEYYDGVNTSLTGLDPTTMYNVSLSASGPIIKDKLTFFATARKFENEGWLTGRNAYTPYSSFFEILPIDTDLNNYTTRYGDDFDESKPWFIADTIGAGANQAIVAIDTGLRDSSLVTINNYESQSFQGNLEFKVSNTLKFNLIGTIGSEQGQDYNFDKKLIPEASTNYFRDNYSINLKTTVTPSANTYLVFNGAYRYNSFERYLYEDPYDPRYVNLPGNSAAFQFDTFGNSSNSLFFRSTGTYIAKGEISSQINSVHFVKAGVNFQYDLIDYENINLQPINEGQGVIVPDYVPDEQAQYVTMGIPAVGTTNHLKFDSNPYNIGAYIQDKVELERLVVNIGLRFDYFDANTVIPADPRDPDIVSPTLAANRFVDNNNNGIFDEGVDQEITRDEREAYWWKDVKAKYQISPRVGIAYPISDRSVLHFSYGYFFQMPSYNFLFENSQILLEQSSGVKGIFGNPDLKPERSIQYELGLKQEIFEGTAIEVTGFYKDTRDYVSSGLIQETYNPTLRYATWINRDYSISKGFTFSFNQYVSRKLNISMDYTFSTVEGSNSDPSAEFNRAISTSNESGQSLTKFIQPLDWDRNHIFNTSIFYSGNKWGANLLSQLRSGEPYTPGSPYSVLYGPTASTRSLNNTARLPSQFTVDLNLYKTFTIADTDFQGFLNVYNIFDTQVITNVFGDSGDPDRPLVIGAFADQRFFDNPTNYAEPRRIQLGISISF